jgi:hypothetical protein
MITHWEVALTYIKGRRTLTATALFGERKRPPSSSFVFNVLEVVRQRLCTFGKLASSRVEGDRRHEHPDLNQRADPSEIAAVEVSSGSNATSRYRPAGPEVRCSPKGDLISTPNSLAQVSRLCNRAEEYGHGSS